MAPSAAWEHFSKVENGAKVKCKLCNIVLKYNNSTTNMINHVTKIHKLCLPVQQVLKRRKIENNSNDIENEILLDGDQSDSSTSTILSDEQKHNNALKQIINKVI